MLRTPAQPSLRLVFAVAALLSAAVPASAQLALRVYASGFSAPIAFVQDPTDRTVQFVAEQGGRIRVVRSGIVQATDFLDLAPTISTGGERGLLGMALAPDYPASGRFYVNFTNPAGHTVVARFNRSAGNPLVANPASRFDLAWNEPSGSRFIAQPFTNHNGGNLAFGPDGFLYIGLGDGGSGNDPFSNAQNPATLLGKMLRVDVNVPDPDPLDIGYRVPSGNPFIGASISGVPVRPEIWAFGFRNPFRYSFDDPARGGTGALIIGDVGQVAREEIDYEPAGKGGRNYGWRIFEGTRENTGFTSPPPAYTPLTAPIYDYDRSAGVTVTGGIVYRGTALGPTYRGRYFFGDFGFSRLYSLGLTIDGAGEAHFVNVIDHTAEAGGVGAVGNVSSFGVDADGEMYIVNYTGGTILAVVLVGAVPAITAQPTSVIRSPGTRASFTAAATATQTPSVQWQVSVDGGASFTNIPGATGATYSFLTTLADNGKRYRALFTNIVGSTPTIPALLTVRLSVAADLDGDRHSDLMVWRPGIGTWFWLTSGSGYSYAASLLRQWGSQAAGDQPLLGDIDGDGVSDLVVWRASTGTFFWLTSSTGYSYAAAGVKQWGSNAAGDKPFLADLDGDAKADLVVWRPTDGTWYWLTSTSGYNYANQMTKQWGSNASGDVPILGDIDQDGMADLIVWRASTGTFFWVTSSTGYNSAAAGSKQWGSNAAGDRPLVADMDGDGASDLVVWRASTGTWFWLTSRSGYNYALAGVKQWGNLAAGDVPLLTDVDGDGLADLTVWRAPSGTWFYLTSTSGYNYALAGVKQWGSGAAGDIPLVK